MHMLCEKYAMIYTTHSWILESKASKFSMYAWFEPFIEGRWDWVLKTYVGQGWINMTEIMIKIICRKAMRPLCKLELDNNPYLSLWDNNWFHK